MYIIIYTNKTVKKKIFPVSGQVTNNSWIVYILNIYYYMHCVLKYFNIFIL